MKLGTLQNMPDKPTLHIVATPIGNLGDISERAKQILGEVSLVLAEDTRVAKKLLAHLNVSKPVERFDANASDEYAEELAKRVVKEKSVALVSDAGTPNISDPGWRIIRPAIEAGVGVVPVPGPSALTAALSLAHFPINSFVFLGFPPAKKKRQAFFKNIAEEERVVALYESPHRIEKTLTQLAEETPQREALVAKELTKMYERTWRGPIGDIAEEFATLKEQEKKGEYVIVLSSLKH